jgi:hypothetical protein
VLKALKVFKGLKVSQRRQQILVLLELKVLKGLQEQVELLEQHRELKEQVGQLEQHKELKEQGGQLDLQDLKVLKVPLDLKELKVFKEVHFKGHKELKVLKVISVLQDLKVHKDQVDLVEVQDLQVLKDHHQIEDIKIISPNLKMLLIK